MAEPIDRRGFMKTAAAAMVMGGSGTAEAAPDAGFTLALGGGAARGIAHVVVLEALDELGVKPTMIAGTSMGSIIGAMYASGMSGLEIRNYGIEILSSRLTTLQRLFPGKPASWASVFGFGAKAVLEATTLMSVVLPPAVPGTFAELTIPMRIVAADFYGEQEFVMSEGPLHRAIGASSCIPVLLSPVRWEDRVLIDGGFVNPTPFDILEDQPGAIVAVDVTGGAGATGVATAIPNPLESWMGSALISSHSLVNERLKRIKPDLLLRPKVGAFSLLGFHRINEILEASEPVREVTKRELAALLEPAR